MLGNNRFEVAAEVRRVISETLSVAIGEIHNSTRIAEDLNASSMDVVTLVMSLDDVFGVEIDLNEIPPINVTVDWIVEYIFRLVTP
jgi:acyl carrier protein